MAVDTKELETTGTGTRENGSETLKALWAKADEANAQKADSLPGDYIPWAAIDIDMSILPRTALSQTKVAEYSEILDQLPPILVQNGTLKLVDGRNRTEAAAKANVDLIRVEYTDVEGDDLIDLAFTRNREHGIPLTLEERRAAVRRKLLRNPEWSQSDIAAWAGVSPRTVYTIVHENDPVVPETASNGAAPPAAPRSTAKTRREQAEQAKRSGASAKPVSGAAPKQRPSTRASSNGTSVPKPMPTPYMWQQHMQNALDTSPRMLLSSKIKRAEWPRVRTILAELKDDVERWFREWDTAASEMQLETGDGAQPVETDETGDNPTEGGEIEA